MLIDLAIGQPLKMSLNRVARNLGDSVLLWGEVGPIFRLSLRALLDLAIGVVGFLNFWGGVG